MAKRMQYDPPKATTLQGDILFVVRNRPCESQAKNDKFRKQAAIPTYSPVGIQPIKPQLEADKYTPMVNWHVQTHTA
jgi:hypothetical protein